MTNKVQRFKAMSQGSDNIGNRVTGINTFRKYKTLANIKYDSSEMKDSLTLNSCKNVRGNLY